VIATVQRVSEAKVEINNSIYSEIGDGVLILLCVERDDDSKQAIKMSDKILNFCILEGDSGTMSASLRELEEDVMIISQFTLAAITNKGNKPSFHKAAKPNKAKEIYDQFVQIFKDSSLNVQTGKFGEIMNITLTNKGPITFNFRT
jgi:D-tyrosyl-tRNA(Tyr) deacylase|tara:strand:+ start:160 stop:597 length:438 start_codon:yes stop_codon:yes gene_type:complete